MKFKPVSNGGEPGELEAFYRIYPEIKTLIGTREVSIISIFTQHDLPNHPFEEAANGFNSSGKIILMNKKSVVIDITWNDIHARRKQVGLKPNINSPQTEISGTETMCIILHDHAGDHDTTFKGIHLDVFIAQDDKTFGEFPDIKAWILEPTVRRELRAIGVIC